MIAIEIHHRPNKNCDFFAVSGWTEFICTEYPAMFDFFQECIDQHLILNTFSLTVDSTVDVFKYYSTDTEKAQIFQERFENHHLNFSKEKFSMKEFWNRYQFDIEIKLNPVDFDNQQDLFDLVNKDTGELWATTYPMGGGPFDTYFALERQFHPK